jgi:hypothetical protein
MLVYVNSHYRAEFPYEIESILFFLTIVGEKPVCSRPTQIPISHWSELYNVKSMAKRTVCTHVDVCVDAPGVAGVEV